MEIICYFLPAIISMILLEKKFKKDNYSTLQIIENYCVNVMIINIIILFMSYFVFKINEYVFTIQFSLKYLLISIIFSFFVAFIELNTDNIFKETFWKKIFQKFIDLLKKNKRKIYRILFFIAIFSSIFILDYNLRIISNSQIMFYNQNELTPNIITFSYIFLIIGIISLLPKVLSLITLVSSYTISLVLFLLNYFLVIIKNKPFSIADISKASEGAEYINYIFGEITPKFIILVIISLILFIIAVILKLKIEKIVISKVKRHYVIELIIIIALFLLIRFIGINRLDDYEKGLFIESTQPKYHLTNIIDGRKTIVVGGMYEYHILDVKLFIKANTNHIDYKEITKLLNKRSSKYKENEYTGIFKNKNLIMIMLEGIDYSIINDQTMPTLTKLMKNGWSFPNRYAQYANGNGLTLSTEYTSLTGLYHSDYIYNINNNDYSYSLPSILSKNGYITNSIHENNGIYYNREVLHKSLGFEKSIFLLDEYPDMERYLDKNMVSNNVYKEIVSQNEKFMTYMITMSGHGPYDNNYMCYEEGATTERECIEIGHKRTDDFIKELIDKLEKSNLMDDTVLVLYSDHHAYSYNYTEEDLSIYKEIDENKKIKNIPFVIYSKDIKRKEFKDIYVNDIDMVPTLLNLFGIKYNPSNYIGTDIFSSNHKNIIMFTDYSWYDGNIYSNNILDFNNEYYKNTTKYVKNTLDINNMIISNNYYKYISKE